MIDPDRTPAAPLAERTLGPYVNDLVGRSRDRWRLPPALRVPCVCGAAGCPPAVSAARGPRRAGWRRVSATSLGATCAALGSAAISSRMPAAAFLNAGSVSTPAAAPRGVAGLNWRGSSDTAAPAATARSLLMKWSARRGVMTSGTPPASAARVVPAPPWATTRSHRSITAPSCAKRSIRTRVGSAVMLRGSTWGPTVTRTLTSSSARPWRAAENGAR